MPGNRALNITVNVVGHQNPDSSYNATATFTQMPSSPPMNGVVDINGNINLDNLPGNSNYNWAIGINFTLYAQITDNNGKNVPCVWATPTSKACAVYAPGGSPATNMVVSRDPGNPLYMTIANPNNDQSKSKANRTYTYKPGVMLPSANNYFISLDPMMINTGVKVIDDDEAGEDEGALD